MEENKKLTPEQEKREEYIRRQAVLKSKYPKIYDETTPKSIQDEYTALNTLVDSLRVRGVWKDVVSSDGYTIDGFVAKKYENALIEFSKANAENLEYISLEEDAAFEFPEINFEELNKKIEEVVTDVEWRRVNSELMDIQYSTPWPMEVIKQLDELRDKLAMTKTIKEEPATPAVVNESKFAQIYGKAKGRMQTVFSKIKSFFKQNSQDKINKINKINEGNDSKADDVEGRN